VKTLAEQVHAKIIQGITEEKNQALKYFADEGRQHARRQLRKTNADQLRTYQIKNDLTLQQIWPGQNRRQMVEKLEHFRKLPDFLKPKKHIWSPKLAQLSLILISPQGARSLFASTSLRSCF